MEASGTPSPLVPKIILDGLDGTHMGVAVVLWRAALDKDSETRKVVVGTVPAAESLRSAVELLMSLASTVAEANGESDSGARVLGVLAENTTGSAKAQVCREIAQTLADGSGTGTMRITAVPVFALIDLCVLLSRLIAHRTGAAPREQVEEWTEYVRQAAMTAA